MAFLFVSPANHVSLYAGVSATVDSDYTDDWLCDGRPMRPIRGTSTSFSATITPLAAGTVDFVGVSHHNLSVSMVLGADLTGSVLAGALQADGTRLNSFLSVTSVPGVDSVTISITSNGATVIIGEVYFGTSTTIRAPFYRDFSIEVRDHARDQDNDISDVTAYDDGTDGGRTLQGTWPALTTAEKDSLIACFKAQRNKTRPTLLVPDSTVNDLWVGYIKSVKAKPDDAVPNRWEVSLTFDEIPRVRW
jgi:hypothetical protein